MRGIAGTGNADNSHERVGWIGVLARASCIDIEECWDACDDERSVEWLRAPAYGLVMVRGRAGGSGAPFNLGEMAVTHCSLRLSSGHIGFGYVQGRNRRHVELAAVLDALLQSEDTRKNLLARVIEPLRIRQDERRVIRGRKAESTKVEFFTLVRGGNPT